jgi:hypothetical protein
MDGVYNMMGPYGGEPISDYMVEKISQVPN